MTTNQESVNESPKDEFKIIQLFDFDCSQPDNQHDFIKSVLFNNKLYFKKEYGSPADGCAKCMYRKIFQDLFIGHKTEILNNSVLCNLTGTDKDGVEHKFFLHKSEDFGTDLYEYNIDEEYQMCKGIERQKLFENLKIVAEQLHIDKSGCKICVRKQPQ